MAQQKTTARRQMKARSESTSKNGTRRAVARKSQNHSGSGAKFGVKLQKLQKLKVALACDWLTSVGGAEQVLLSLHKLFPQAPIYTSQYNPKGIDWFQDADVRTGWMQVLPSCTRRITPMFRQYYFNHLDLSEYNLVISVSGAEAKGIQTGPQTLHVSYCHVPTQYYWQLYDTYIENPGFGVLNPVVRLGFQTLVKPLRQGDFREAQKPDAYITISQYAAEQIKKYYQRPATIIAPPVAVDKFALSKAPAKRQRQGFVMTELLSASLLDMDYHSIADTADIDVNAFEKASMEKMGMIPEIIVRYRSTYFSHIFTTGYSAGYYSYTWAAVLDSDAFQAFKETGDIYNQEVATAYRKNILERGGTEDPMVLYQRFRGKMPNPDYLLIKRGFLPAAK